MSSYTEKWVAVAKQIMGDPKTPVTCPFCQRAILEVKDAVWNDEVFNRWITCPSCKETTALQYRRKN